MPLPQTPLELLSSQLDWAHKNINNNFDFVPDDKLNWKPAPEAKSVLEIVNHMTNSVHMITHALTGSHKHELQPATNRDEAKALVTKVIEAHQDVLRSLSPSDLAQTVTLPFGEMPKAIVAGLPVVELINHHGQITYIETLLGDPESHLVLS